jgi:hypothetical protein
MRTIWKFVLSLDENVYQIPQGAQILYVREQAGDPCVWALVDSDAALVRRRFSIIGTGDELPRPIEDGMGGDYYIGSAHCGPFVWHVFDLGEEIQ